MAVTDQDVINAIRAVRRELSALKKSWDNGNPGEAYYYACGAEGFAGKLRQVISRAQREGKADQQL